MVATDIAYTININARKYSRSLNECGKCPKKIQHGNGIITTWTAGLFLINGSHLTSNRICADKINNTIFGPIPGKTEFVKNKLNAFKRYPGFPGGSGAPIRNEF